VKQSGNELWRKIIKASGPNSLLLQQFVYERVFTMLQEAGLLHKQLESKSREASTIGRADRPTKNKKANNSGHTTGRRSAR
jgi:hypothetical protein